MKALFFVQMVTLISCTVLQGAIVTLEHALETFAFSSSIDTKYTAWEYVCRSDKNKRECSWGGLASAIGFNPRASKSSIIEKLDAVGIVFSHYDIPNFQDREENRSLDLYQKVLQENLLSSTEPTTTAEGAELIQSLKQYMSSLPNNAQRNQELALILTYWKSQNVLKNWIDKKIQSLKQSFEEIFSKDIDSPQAWKGLVKPIEDELHSLSNIIENLIMLCNEITKAPTTSSTMLKKEDFEWVSKEILNPIIELKASVQERIPN